MNRKIDKLHKARTKIDLAIKDWQEKCKHRKTTPQFIYCIPGSSGYYNVCIVCDKMISLNNKLTSEYFSKQKPSPYYWSNLNIEWDKKHETD